MHAAEEMLKSDSKEKYVHVRCERHTIPLQTEINHIEDEVQDAKKEKRMNKKNHCCEIN